MVGETTRLRGGEAGGKANGEGWATENGAISIGTLALLPVLQQPVHPPAPIACCHQRPPSPFLREDAEESELARLQRRVREVGSRPRVGGGGGQAMTAAWMMGCR